MVCKAQVSYFVPFLVSTRVPATLGLNYQVGYLKLLASHELEAGHLWLRGYDSKQYIVCMNVSTMTFYQFLVGSSPLHSVYMS